MQLIRISIRIIRPHHRRHYESPLALCTERQLHQGNRALSSAAAPQSGGAGAGGRDSRDSSISHIRRPEKAIKALQERKMQQEIGRDQRSSRTTSRTANTLMQRGMLEYQWYLAYIHGVYIHIHIWGICEINAVFGFCGMYELCARYGIYNTSNTWYAWYMYMKYLVCIFTILGIFGIYT